MTHERMAAERDARTADAVARAVRGYKVEQWLAGSTKKADMVSLSELQAEGYAVIPDESDHYVTFAADGWFIEHSVACRIAGTIGTCDFNQAIRDAYGAPPPPEDFGRWCITGIDDEGMPNLRRVSG